MRREQVEGMKTGWRKADMKDLRMDGMEIERGLGVRKEKGMDGSNSLERWREERKRWGGRVRVLATTSPPSCRS